MTIIEQEWEGPNGRRGIDTAVTPYTREETNAQLEALGLPILMDDETIVDWHRRVYGLEAAKVILPQVVEPATGEGNG